MRPLVAVVLVGISTSLVTSCGEHPQGDTSVNDDASAGANGGSSGGTASTGGTASDGATMPTTGSTGDTATGATTTGNTTTGTSSTGSSTAASGTTGTGTTGTGADAGSPLTGVGTYKGTCDGSAAVALDADYFLDGNDENQALRVYRRATSAAAVQTIDISSGLGLDTSDEADIEDFERVGTRVYGMASHGRTKKGELSPERHRFFAFDLSGSAPSLAIKVVGYSSTLIEDMLVSANWVTPDSGIIALVAAASQFSVDTDTSLVPEDKGLNIEGIGALPNAARPGQLLIGLRNPLSSGKAIVISLLNPDMAITGSHASFGESMLLDLGGLGIRGMAWSDSLQRLLIVAGEVGTGSSFRFFSWTGQANSAPVAITNITAPADSSAEAIVVYPGKSDVQVLFDQGDAMIGGSTCKDASASSRYFTDAIVTLE